MYCLSVHRTQVTRKFTSFSSKRILTEGGPRVESSGTVWLKSADAQRSRQALACLT